MNLSTRSGLDIYNLPNDIRSAAPPLIAPSADYLLNPKLPIIGPLNYYFNSYNVKCLHLSLLPKSRPSITCKYPNSYLLNYFATYKNNSSLSSLPIPPKLPFGFILTPI